MHGKILYWIVAVVWVTDTKYLTYQTSLLFSHILKHLDIFPKEVNKQNAPNNEVHLYFNTKTALLRIAKCPRYMRLHGKVGNYDRKRYPLMCLYPLSTYYCISTVFRERNLTPA